MTIKTLERIHKLLLDDVTHKAECHERNRKARNKARDDLDLARENGPAENIALLKEELQRADDDYQYTYQRLTDAEDALQDFETHDFN